jgi:hypothetical protein
MVKLIKQIQTKNPKEINSGRWTNREQYKQTNKHKKHSRFRNNRISALVVLVLLLQHPIMVLVFKQTFCLSLASWLRSLTSFFSCLSVAAA